MTHPQPTQADIYRTIITALATTYPGLPIHTDYPDPSVHELTISTPAGDYRLPLEEADER